MSPAPFNQSILSLELDGRGANPQLSRLVTDVLVRQELGAPSLAEIVFTLLEPTDVTVLKIGKALVMRIGREQALLFDGEISSLSYDYGAAGVPLLRVRAFDRLQRLRRNFRPRALEKLSVADLATQLATASPRHANIFCNMSRAISTFSPTWRRRRGFTRC
jgi:hypothetical protein